VLLPEQRRNPSRRQEIVNLSRYREPLLADPIPR
jgi:hypothetical protein